MRIGNKEIILFEEERFLKFRVGEKVCCLNDRCGTWKNVNLTKGKIYELVDKQYDDQFDEYYIYIIGDKRNKDGWEIDRFARVVEIK